MDLVQESAPEREELKRALLAQASAAAPPDAIIATSTSGLLPTRLAAEMQGPERFVVGHPFNPVYLLPLVEVCAAERTAPETVARAAAIYRSVAMRPLDRPPRDRRLHRRPPARGAVARGAVAGRRRRRHRGGDRRRHPLRRGAALGVDGHLPHLPAGGRRGRHAPFHGPVRAGAPAALDPSHRRAGADRRAARQDRGPVRRPGRRALDRRAQARPRRLPGRGAAGPERARATAPARWWR